MTFADDLSIKRKDADTSQAVAPWLAIVGLGEDGVEGLSAAARSLVETAAVVVGGARHLELAHKLIKGEARPWKSPLIDSLPDIVALRGERVCVLASGDPFLFGVGTTLTRAIDPAEMIAVPAPSSLSLAASRMGWAQQDVVNVTLCGRPLETLRPHLQRGAKLLVLSADADTPAAVADYMTRLGFGPSQITLLQSLGGPREAQAVFRAQETAPEKIDPLNLMAIDVEALPEAQALPLLPGRPESWFEHDNQITKSEIRAVTLASLAPAPGDLLWDIGCGTGSVSIEWLLTHPKTRAIAIEPRDDRRARAARNAIALGVPRMDIQDGKAPDIFAELPAPNAVFLGGGGGGLGVIDAAYDALKPGGRLVMNAVVLESQQAVSDAYFRLGGALTRISVERLSPVGTMHGFRPAMGILHYCVQKPF